VRTISLQQLQMLAHGQCMPLIAKWCKLHTGKSWHEPVLDESGATILDMLCKPAHPIEDYLTRFSGITAELLKDVDATLSDVQTKLKEIIPANAVLVGHSLENDMIALKWYHPAVIDTAVLFGGGMGSKRSLRSLADSHLSRKIQTGSEGHSSVEDAKAALDLVQLKLKSPSGFAEAEKLEESIFARLAAHKKASSMADTRGRCSKHTSTTADLKHCWEDSQSTAAAVAACKAGKHLVVARLGELGKGELPKDESDPRVQATAAHLEALLAEYAQPASLVFVLCTPRVDEVFELHRRKGDAKGKPQLWGVLQDAALKRSVLKARGGLLFAHCT